MGLFKLITFYVIQMSFYELCICGSLNLTFESDWCKMGSSLVKLEELINDNQYESITYTSTEFMYGIKDGQPSSMLSSL